MGIAGDDADEERLYERFIVAMDSLNYRGIQELLLGLGMMYKAVSEMEDGELKEERALTVKGWIWNVHEELGAW